MNRRTFLRAATAGAGALAVGGAVAWYGFRDDHGPAVPGAVSTGRRWRVPLPDEPDALLLTGDTLLALGRTLTAYGTGDGKVRWQQDLGRNTVQTSRAGDAPVRIAGDGFVLRTQEGGAGQVRVAALGDGTERWRRAFAGYVGDLVLTEQGTVVTVADGPGGTDGSGGRGLLGFSGPADAWRQPVQAGDGPFDLLAAGGTIFAAARELAAHDAATGARKWGVAAPEGHVFGRPVVLGPLVVALGMRYVDDDYLYRNESVHAFDAASGQARWQYDAPGGFLADGAPLLTGRGIVAVHEDGTLTGLDPADGSERWNFDWDFADIIAAGDRVFVATTDGVAVVDPVTGQRDTQLDEPNAFRLAGSGSRLCVAAGNTLTAYDL
ncbi:PQQ-binding-like beta-propeller repeat protein [Dactylosporangium sp. NPDC000244]|uniref:outer membrane protein assembly factor BamB family protein n=1 Tax=Dactylosporangium sp. NPDC000244 TaxID=3154365 RepID=UPI0033236607